MTGFSNKLNGPTVNSELKQYDYVPTHTMMWELTTYRIKNIIYLLKKFRALSTV